jgi:hypothetical protein
MDNNQKPYQSFTNGKYIGLHNKLLKRIRNKNVEKTILKTNEK